MNKIYSTIASVLAAAAVMAVVIVFDNLDHERRAASEADKLRSKLNLFAGRLEQSVNHQLQLTRGLAAFVRSRPGFSEQDFDLFSNALSGKQKGIRSLQLAPGGIVTYITNKAENAKALGHNLLGDPNRRELVLKAIANREYVVAGPITLLQGGQAIIARLPVFLPEETGKDEFWGFATILINPLVLIRDAGILDGLPGIDMALRGKDALGKKGEVFHGNPKVFENPVAEVPVTLAAGSWSLGATWAKNNLPLSQTENGLLWILGYLLSILVGAFVYLSLHRRHMLQVAVYEATKKQRENEARLRAVIDNTPIYMNLKDTEGRYLLINKPYEEWFRLSADKIVGKKAIDFLGNTTEENDLSAAEQKVLETGQAWESEISVPRDGKMYDRILIKFPVKTDDGTITGLGTVAIDITERKKLDRLKSEFISTVSHELRTPLTSIKGSLGLMAGNAMGMLPDKAKDLVDVAYKNTERLIYLVNDILDAEKLESEKMEFDFQPLDFQNLVEEAVETNTGFAKEYGVEIVYSDIASGIMVRGDVNRLTQVISNLLSNAVKFSPEGAEVEISIAEVDGAIRASISDHGAGISEEFRDHIFDRFALADASDSRQKNGTGLGLSIGKSFVEKHGGTIGFDSEVGAGSTFFFTLPIMK